VAGDLAPSDEAPRVDVVVLQIGGSRFALAADSVEELTHAFRFDVLPDAPPVVAGAVNLRGAVLPLFDLRARLGLPEKALDPADHFVVARAGRRRVVLHVDRVLELRSVSVTPIEDAHDLLSQGTLVTGLSPLADGTLFVYDLSQLLSDAEAAVLDQVLDAARKDVPP